MTQERDDQEDDADTAAGESPKSDFASSRGTQVKLRIDEAQMKHVQKLATDQRTTVAATVRWLIDRGLEAESLRGLNDVATDIGLNWAQFGGRLMALALEDDLLKALEDRRYEDARAFAVALRKYHAEQARKRVEKLCT